MGRSPVTITRTKKFTLENKLKKLKNNFTNKNYIPRVEFFVVMTGNSDFSKLPEDQALHTISLKDFLKFANRGVFNNRFRPHPNEQGLQRDLAIFDALFLGPQTAPKTIRVGGYTARQEIFEHPREIYKEYLANAEISKTSEALIRVWNFKKIGRNKGLTPEGRIEIISREREVLQYINLQNRDLYNHCLRSLAGLESDEITAGYSEIFELPPSHTRFNEFIGKYGDSLDEQARITIAKLLIAKFSDLHELKIAHRDIANHSLWLSPSKEIALSNFISAYHQPIGTVGDYRPLISVGAIEAKEMLETSNLTPFQQDVHAIGLVCWHLLKGRRMSPANIESILSELLGSSEWYTDILIDAISAKYNNATEFFEALKSNEPSETSKPTFDDTELEPYRHPISHTRQFREDGDFIEENLDREIYISNGRMIKAWLSTGRDVDEPQRNFQALKFLKRLDKLSAAKPRYIAYIREYGLASKSGSMYLVTDIIEGNHWQEIDLEPDKKIELINKLISAIEHLHSIDIAHGDLHPKNIIISGDENDVFLIDIPDFSPTMEEAKNHLYSPENIDYCTPFQRDIFAAIKMSSELLDIAWGEASTKYPYIADAITTELNDIEFGFQDIGRFKKSVEKTINNEETKQISITVNYTGDPIAILPDNGKLYIKIEAGKNHNELRVSFIGIGGILTAIYSKHQKLFIAAWAPKLRTSVNYRDAQDSQLEITATLNIEPGRPQNLSQLTSLLNDNETIYRAIELYDEQLLEAEKLEEADQSLQIFEAFKNNNEKTSPLGKIEVSTKSLWQAILDTETESSPYIELATATLVPSDADTANELILPYEADIDPLGTFTSADEIEAILIDPDYSERYAGDISLKKSAANEVRLTKARSIAYSLKEGDLVFFRTKLDRASYRKRKAALRRLLDGEGVLPELLNLFDPSCTTPPQNYGITVSDEEFSKYDRPDHNGNKISLNEQQREAFRKLINSGPLSLLQGPPGTGKTEFIAAFVHYLIEKLKVSRILLVSQSHEAVNTAAERIRKHCTRFGTPLEIVRFSNRESSVSQGLKDVHSQALTAARRELFNAEYRHRAMALDSALGLEKEFISKITEAELKLFRQIDHLEMLLNQAPHITLEDDLKLTKKIAIQLDKSIRSALIETYKISISKEESIQDAKLKLLSKLCMEHNVTAGELKKTRALARISRDIQDALSSERVNCDEFYARSRQLIAGTCVGIGLGHIGIQSNIYDFVIIDEAARSISSELAIAMQSAKRILLVGDHLQLPPTYTDAHKAAIARRLGINKDKPDLDIILRSDFARAFSSPYGSQTSATLLTQYRMAPPIGDLVSHTFYKGKLLNGPRIIPDFYLNAPNQLSAPVTWVNTSHKGERAHHQDDRGKSIYNRCEAEETIRILREISNDGDLLANLATLKEENEALIGVICMYSEQKKLIRQKFNQEIWSDGFKELVKIDTVDSYQGKENRIIILSLTRSDKAGTPGFLKIPNRINVAMSRAMDRLIIIGNADMWDIKNKEKPLGLVVSHMKEMGEAAGYRFLNV